MSTAPRSSRTRVLVDVSPLRALDAAAANEGTAWLQGAMTTFAASVGSFLPGDLASYARLYHPIDAQGPDRWTGRAAREGLSLENATELAALQTTLTSAGLVEVGSLPLAVLEPLVEHLARATATPDRCYFAAWEGFGDSPVSSSQPPVLELPHRRYHVFAGPVAGATTSLSAISFCHRSPNLWWPADRAWCVATEVDLAWTYVGAGRDVIANIVADSRLEASLTTADAPR